MGRPTSALSFRMVYNAYNRRKDLTMDPYEQHREEFAQLQRDLDALDVEELGYEEYMKRYDEITNRRIGWHERDQNSNF